MQPQNWPKCPLPDGKVKDFLANVLMKIEDWDAAWDTFVNDVRRWLDNDPRRG